MLNILHIEDNEGDIILTEQAFKLIDTKTKIEFVKNGAEGMDYLKKRGDYKSSSTPDLILLDINMPLMDGKEVLINIKNDQELRKIPVIMLTTSASEKDIEFCYDNGANAYIPKAIDFSEFMVSIEKIEGFWLKYNLFPTVNPN